MSKPIYILDLGGSVVNGGTLNAAFLTAFATFVKECVHQGVSFGIVVGGGMIARVYQDFLRQHFTVNDEDLDMIGIRPTKLNAELIRIILKEYAYESVIEDPTQKIKESNAKVFVFSGWKPGWSTDYVSVLAAKRFEAQEILCLSNIKGVYQLKDGRIQQDMLLERLSWDDYEHMVGRQWTPGMRIPFDPVATKEARAQGLKVVMLLGEDIANIRHYLNNEPFIGSVIS